MNNTLDQETDYGPKPGLDLGIETDRNPPDHGPKPGLDLGIETDRNTPLIMDRFMEWFLDWTMEMQ